MKLGDKANTSRVRQSVIIHEDILSVTLDMKFVIPVGAIKEPLNSTGITAYFSCHKKNAPGYLNHEEPL